MAKVTIVLTVAVTVMAVRLYDAIAEMVRPSRLIANIIISMEY